MRNSLHISTFIRKQFFRAGLLWHSWPRYLLYWFYGYGKFHITPTRYKRYCVDVIEYVNQRNNRNSLLDIGCGIGDILLSAKYQNRVGLDHNQKVLDALKFRSRLLCVGRVDSRLFRFGVDFVYGKYDVIIICNWIHNIEPNLLRQQFEKIVNDNLNLSGELIFDTVKGDHYPFFHDEEFLARNLDITIKVLGEYRDRQLKGEGLRRIVSFSKSST